MFPAPEKGFLVPSWGWQDPHVSSTESSEPLFKDTLWDVMGNDFKKLMIILIGHWQNQTVEIISEKTGASIKFFGKHTGVKL